MEIVFIVTSIAFTLWEIRNILVWVSMWQSKEYRLDRLSTHLKETTHGKGLLRSSVSWIKWFLLIGYVGVVFHDKWVTYYQFLVCALYLYEAGVVIYELVSYHQFKRPVRTVKAYVITFLSLLLIAILYLLPMTDVYLWFLLLDRLTVVVVALFVFFFSFPTEIYTDYIIQKAKRKIEQQKQLLVIAVSGSYGKSSTKEYIAQLVSKAFNVVKTSGSNNTPIGIAQTILTRISPETEIFVVEMGAYKRGEIAQLCDIVHPNISVTTSVSDQHLSLYGSLKNAIDTEVELIHSLPKDGLSLFNGNNIQSLDLFKKTKKKKILYKVSNSDETNVDVVAYDVAVKKFNVTLTVRLAKKKWKLSVPLVGGHMVENLLPALYLAEYLGMSSRMIKQALHDLTPPAKTMIRKLLPHDITVIDDTFNASPESVLAVLNYMKVYKTKKLLVLTPLIELGENAKMRHIAIGEKIGQVCDFVYLTNANFSNEIMQGVTAKNSTCKVIIEKRPDIASRMVFQILNKGDIVVFEGKEAAYVNQSLEKLFKENTSETL